MHAARAVPRRAGTALAAALALSGTLTACGGGDIPIDVAGAYGRQPTVKFDKGAKPGEGLHTSVLVKGKGAAVRAGDLVVADYTSYRWSDDGSTKRLVTSYATGRPSAFPAGRLVPGLDKALQGRKVGSRVMAVIPPKQGFGDKGDSAHNVTARDSLVFVLDIRATFPKTALAQGTAQPGGDPKLPVVSAPTGQGPATVTIPRTAAPRKLVVRTLQQGSGPAVRGNQLVAMQFSGVRWRDGKPFYSTWKNEGRPAAEVLGVKQDIRGFDEGLVGRHVGSRVLLVVPPSYGYGAKGLPRWGIKGTDTLVYVVDILGAY